MKELYEQDSRSIYDDNLLQTKRFLNANGPKMKSRMNSSNFKPMKKHASSKSKEAQNNLKTIAQVVVSVFQYNIGYYTKKRKEF